MPEKYQSIVQEHFKNKAEGERADGFCFGGERNYFYHAWMGELGELGNCRGARQVGVLCVEVH